MCRAWTTSASDLQLRIRHTARGLTDSLYVGRSRLTLPSGVVSLLFTDVEGSTRLWAADVDAMFPSLQLHDESVRRAVESRGGYVVSS